MEYTGSIVSAVAKPDYFCPNCGEQVVVSVNPGVTDTMLSFKVTAILVCDICNSPLIRRNRYKVPLVDSDGNIVEVDPEEVEQKLQSVKEGDKPYRLLSDNEDTINVFVNGELNGIDTGKKIREKNEQLKKKVAGYEYEQRNLRAEIDKQIAEKHKREGINQ